MMLREVTIGWEWEVYVEMFLAGIAAGAYLIAMIMEWFGRGRSPIARAAHFIALPFAIIATGLLVMKLERPERFWHMIIQSENIPLPMFKWWAPISLGSWLLMGFSGFATLSFIDALISRGWFSLGPWRKGNTLHGSTIGKFFAVGGAVLAIGVGSYSGALLSVNAVRGWADTMFIGPFFMAISGATGAAMLLLIETIRRTSLPEERFGLERANVLMTGWQLLTLLIFAISLGGAIIFFTTSIRTTVALIGGAILSLIALLMLHFQFLKSGAIRNGVGATMILLSGFLLRYAVVMGPQHAID